MQYLINTRNSFSWKKKKGVSYTIAIHKKIAKKSYEFDKNPMKIGFAAPRCEILQKKEKWLNNKNIQNDWIQNTSFFYSTKTIVWDW